MQVLVRIFPTGTHEAQLVNAYSSDPTNSLPAIDAAIDLIGMRCKAEGIKYSVISGSIYTGEQLNRV